MRQDVESYVETRMVMGVQTKTFDVCFVDCVKDFRQD